MHSSPISVQEVLLCFSAFEKNPFLYFDIKKPIIKSAEEAICSNINEAKDYISIKEFLDMFSSLIDSNTKENVENEVLSYLKDMCEEYSGCHYSAEEIREVSGELEDLESTYGYLSDFSGELEKLAREREEEVSFCESDEYYPSSKKTFEVSDKYLDSIFSKLL